MVTDWKGDFVKGFRHTAEGVERIELASESPESNARMTDSYECITTEYYVCQTVHYVDPVTGDEVWSDINCELVYSNTRCTESGGDGINLGTPSDPEIDPDGPSPTGPGADVPIGDNPDEDEFLCADGSKPGDEGCPEDLPCEGDPLTTMEISDYNDGKNSNRFGCVRTGKTNCNGRKKHGGIDLKAPVGTSVYAIESGTVVLAAEDGKFGNWIIIQNGDTFYAYAHLRDEALYSVGEDVNSHSLLGYVGETGNVPDGEAHLHLEVKRQTEMGQTYNNSEYINPEDVLGTDFDGNGNETDNENCN
jgi:hypothetical protein